MKAPGSPTRMIFLPAARSATLTLTPSLPAKPWSSSIDGILLPTCVCREKAEREVLSQLEREEREEGRGGVGHCKVRGLPMSPGEEHDVSDITRTASRGGGEAGRCSP